MEVFLFTIVFLHSFLACLKISYRSLIVVNFCLHIWLKMVKEVSSLVISFTHKFFFYNDSCRLSFWHAWKLPTVVLCMVAKICLHIWFKISMSLKRFFGQNTMVGAFQMCKKLDLLVCYIFVTFFNVAPITNYWAESKWFQAEKVVSRIYISFFSTPCVKFFIFYLRKINAINEECVCRGTPSTGIITNSGLISCHNLSHYLLWFQ